MKEFFKEFFKAFASVLYTERFSILALVLVIGAWLLFSTIVPTKYVDLFAYGILGYYWLGSVVAPWTEAKLKKLFS